MDTAQQSYEKYTNDHHQATPEYHVGEKVWLDLHNIWTQHPSKKLDNHNAQFTVLEQVGSHTYCLDTPPGVHNVFHTWLLHAAGVDPFPSQHQSDSQPPTIIGE